MYPQILVPLDGSALAQQVLPYVRLMAKALGSQVDLLRISEPVLRTVAEPAESENPSETAREYLHVAPNTPRARSRAPTEPAHGGYVSQIADSVRAEAMDYLEKVEEQLRGTVPEIDCTVQEGYAASYIVDEAEKDPETLIAMATHGRSGITRWALGSVTDKVLHAAANPLLIVRATDETPTASEARLETVIVPLDGSSLAEQVLPHVAALAKAMALKVMLVRVTPSSADYARYGGTEYPGSLDPRTYEEVSKTVDGEARDYLRQVEGRLRQEGVSSLEERLLSGHAAAAIVDIAQETPNNLVAMTTHGHSGVGRWVLGSVTDRVVRQSGDPVLVIRAVGEGTEKA